MAYDEGLAQSIRDVLGDRHDVGETRMFGGIAFMVRGHMAVGILGEDLMVRVGPDAYDACVRAPHARPMDFTGKVSKGMVFVGPEGTASDADLERWIDRALAFNATKPVKAAKKKAKAKKKVSRTRRA